MKFEPQCKTRADLYREWARVLDMCDGTSIEPVCAIDGILIDDPAFSDDPEAYEFPIAIVEGKLVLRGDEVYSANGTKFVAIDGDGDMFYGKTENYRPTLLIGNSCTWNPPRKTITINGKEFAAPHENGEWVIDLDINHYGWDKKEDADAVEAAIIEALEFRPPKM